MIGRFVLFALVLSPLASGRDADSFRRALEARYQHARTLKAVFYERYEDGSGGMSAESGIVYFSRPGRMRWDYTSPQQKLFLVDGTNVWLYVPADHTASRAKVKDSSDWRTPFALLTGKANLSKLCRALDVAGPPAGSLADSDAKPDSAGDTVLRCIPRSVQGGENLQDVFLEMDADARLVRIVIRQPGNSRTEFRFGNWEENIPIPEAQFHFLPPSGVNVVDEQSLASEAR